MVEESGEIAGTNPDYQWIIDPWMAKIPRPTWSGAFRTLPSPSPCVKGKTEQAVVYDPNP